MKETNWVNGSVNGGKDSISPKICMQNKLLDMLDEKIKVKIEEKIQERRKKIFKDKLNDIDNIDDLEQWKKDSELDRFVDEELENLLKEREKVIKNQDGGASGKQKKVRKHKGIVQIGGKIGKLRKGYKYSGKKLKSGIPQIVKVIRKKMN